MTYQPIDIVEELYDWDNYGSGEWDSGQRSGVHLAGDKVKVWRDGLAAELDRLFERAVHSDADGDAWCFDYAARLVRGEL